MNPFKELVSYIKTRYTAWKAKKVKQYVTEQVSHTLMLAHAAELANTPGEQWPLVKSRQAKEIAAVRDGNMTIVDRRSWQFPYLPSSIARVRQPVVKMTPFNVRRFSKSPVPRRALNLIKYGVLSLEWDVVPMEGTFEDADPDTRDRIMAARYCFKNPNGVDSYQTLIEACIEDFCCLGATAVEPQLTPDPARPFKLWSVDASTIRIFPSWSEATSEEEPHYAQMTGLLGERGMVPFMDDELLYIRDNVSNETPFGLGKMEVAFQSITAFLGAQENSGRAGSDQLHRTWLWWVGTLPPAQMEDVRRHLTNQVEGQSKVSLSSGIPKPEVIDIKPIQEGDLLLNWQELLIRVIALAFDLSAGAFLERDVNRSTGEILEDKDFRSAVVPVAIKLSEAFTRFVLHRMLGWKDLQFMYLNIDDPSTETQVKIQQQLYSINATTPNRVLKTMGLPMLATPLADLTQIEVTLLNTEAQAKLKDASMEKQMKMQQGMMQQQQQGGDEQYDQAYDQGYGDAGDASSSGGDQDSYDQAAAAATGGHSSGKHNVPKVMPLQPVKPPQVPMVKRLNPPKVPKLPLAGCRLNAEQIASMSLYAFQSALDAGMITPDIDFLCQQMETQEPGILDQIAEELQSYLKLLKDEQSKQKVVHKEDFNQKEIKRQQQLYRSKKHKPTDIEKNFNVTDRGLPKSRAKQNKEFPR